MDTSALVALYLDSDEWHAEAVRALSQLRDLRRPLLATTDVFDETVTLIRRWGGYARAVEVGEALRESRVLTLVAVDDAAWEEAWALFKKHGNLKLSFTDCTSAALMARLGIESIFTFDSDFRGLGLKSLPDTRR